MRNRALLLLAGAVGLFGAIGGSVAFSAAGEASSPSGAVYAWLDDDAGQLGIGSYVDEPTPVPSDMPEGTNSTAVAAGQSHSLAVTSIGAVYAWGFDHQGQLGNDSTVNTTTPVLTDLPPGVTVTAVAAGWNQSLALTSTGAVYAWGLNRYGELGDGTTKSEKVPVLVHLPAGVKLKAIAAGQYHCLAVTRSGLVYAWGSNAFGQLGDGTTVDSDVPVRVKLPGGVAATAAGAGDSHSLVVTTNGDVYAWGKNNFGQLGNGTTTQADRPVLASLPAGVVATAVAAGGVSPTAKVPNGDYSLALSSTGAVYAWGANGIGQLGNGGTTSSTTPVLTELPTGVAATAIGAGPNYGTLADVVRRRLYVGNAGLGKEPAPHPGRHAVARRSARGRGQLRTRRRADLGRYGCGRPGPVVHARAQPTWSQSSYWLPSIRAWESCAQDTVRLRLSAYALLYGPVTWLSESCTNTSVACFGTFPDAD